MWQKHCVSWLGAVLVLLCLHSGQAQIATYDVRVGSLLRMQQGIGWPLHLQVAEGHEALMRLSETLPNQQYCAVTTPEGVIFDVRNPPNSRFESWTDGCGVRVRNIGLSDEGRWRMTATAGNHTITGWSEVKVTEKISNYVPEPISLKDGQTKTQVDLSSLNNSYCLVAQPFSESSLVPGHCRVTLERTTRAVQGRWSVLLGIPGRVMELHVDRSVAVEAERLDVGFVRDTAHHKLHLYCNILHTEKNITFCRFQKGTEASGFNVIDGLSDGRYSYYGDGFFKRQCGLTIESVASDDYGTWRCTVGVQEWAGNTIQSRTPLQALISVPPEGGNRIRRDFEGAEEELRTIFVESNKTLTLTCRADASLAYCWFQHPNGSQFTPVERQVGQNLDFWYAGENLQSGDCGITFATVHKEDGGVWTCHMGYKYQLGEEIIDRMNVRVTGPLAALNTEVGAVIGGNATLYCHTANGPQPLDYCRFLAPNFVGISLDSTVGANNPILDRFYFAAGRNLDYGDCALTIDPVLEEDLGEWTCAALLHDHILESRDTILLYYDSHAARVPRLRAGLIGTSVGLIVLALVLAGTIWYKKGRPVPWNRPSGPIQRFSNGTDTLSMQNDRAVEPRLSTSTTSSDEQQQA
nr:uncharacterized protein LOC110377335 [Helicoverpa armigera]